MFHSNHRPISHRFRDKQQFPQKIVNFSHPCVFCAPAEVVTLRIGYRRKVRKKNAMLLPDGQKVLR